MTIMKGSVQGEGKQPKTANSLAIPKCYNTIHNVKDRQAMS